MNHKRKQYLLDNREKILKKQKEYRIKNKNKLLKQMKEYKLANKEKIKQYNSEYKLANKEKIKKYNKEYRINNKDIIKKCKKRFKEKYRLAENLRQRIRKALKDKNKKIYKTMNLVGCNIEELKTHLESLFTLNMNWDNYGQYGWHIDHIKPCSMFDLSDPDQQKVCFHYSNLQPLWWDENIRKKDKLI